MKIIFLDIDGVLNSYEYDKTMTVNDSFIDATRLKLLAEIVKKTNAVIVLTSTFKEHWEREFLDCDYMGREIVKMFASENLEIYDKTPMLMFRPLEIKEWMLGKDVESYVIIDDVEYGWGDMSERFVKTNPIMGRGLEKIHVEAAIRILNSETEDS